MNDISDIDKHSMYNNISRLNNLFMNHILAFSLLMLIEINTKKIMIKYVRSSKTTLFFSPEKEYSFVDNIINDKNNDVININTSFEYTAKSGEPLANINKIENDNNVNNEKNNLNLLKLITLWANDINDIVKRIRVSEMAMIKYVKTSISRFILKLNIKNDNNDMLINS